MVHAATTPIECACSDKGPRGWPEVKWFGEESDVHVSDGEGRGGKGHHEFMTQDVPPFTQMISFSVPAGITRFGEEYVNVSAFALGL